MDAIFVSSTLQIGGSESKIVRIANSLAKAGYATSIAYLNPPDTLLNSVDSNVLVKHLHRCGKFSLSSLSKLRNHMRDRYRIVFSVNLYPLLYVLPAVRYFPGVNSRLIGLVNTTDFLSGQRDWGRIYAPFLRRCDQIVFGCREQKEYWTRKYRLPVDRSDHIYNGVDLSVFSPLATFKDASKFRAEIGVPDDALVIGGVGRFAPEKNFELLIEAVGLLAKGGRAVYLVLIGDGGERAALVQEAARHGVSDCVVMPGFLNDIRPALAAMDVFVLPSRAVETFSNAALEAMAMARPVVLSKIGGAAEMVEHKASGYLFEVGDIAQLTDTLATLYDSSLTRDRIGSAAQQRVAEQFSFEAMMCRYKAIIDAKP